MTTIAKNQLISANLIIISIIILITLSLVVSWFKLIGYLDKRWLPSQRFLGRLSSKNFGDHPERPWASDSEWA